TAAKKEGFIHGVLTVLSPGAIASMTYPTLNETMISVPVGGVLATKHIGVCIGTVSVLVIDLGGTSFDIGAINRGNITIDNEPTVERLKLNLSTIAMDTIGAGAGTIIKVYPFTHKVSLGPESAGSEPGPVALDRGGTEPTIGDCDAIMGRLNPDYFLGGKVKLDRKSTRLNSSHV